MRRSVGGSGNSIAQNDQNLGAEESNSSFDRRHSLTGNFVIEPPFGPNRAFFNKGNRTSKIMDGFNISGTFTFSSAEAGRRLRSSGLPSETVTASPARSAQIAVPGQSITGAGSRSE